MSFSALDRENKIKQQQEVHYDLAIIGGGINGAGVARDAASRGMSVALVEAGDFSQGTSSRSSKLIHGGIRYLEDYQFGLVFKALSEKSILFEIAPHLVHHLRFMLPLYKESRVGMFSMGLGMWLYDILALFDAPQPHERLTPFLSKERVPALQDFGLLGSYVYSDAYMDDARLVFETLRSAENYGANSVNYVKATGAEFVLDKKNNQKMVSLNVEDQLSSKKYKISAKHFVSTVGPWTDQVANQLLNPWKKIMCPSKGIHLVLSKERLSLDCAVVMATGKDNRIVFVIPRHDMVILGTTDSSYQGDPNEVTTSLEDVKYILKITNEYFPGANIKPEDIISSYAGVRPLVDDNSETESKVNREHEIINDPRNITFLVGGKYTTYRLMAEQTVNSIIKFFDIEDRVKFLRNKTKKPLNPFVSVSEYNRAKSLVKEAALLLEIPEFCAKSLIERHGAEVFEFEKFKSDLSSFSRSEKMWGYEALHAKENTMCLSLQDFFLRRTHLFLSQRDHGQSFEKLISPLFKGIAPQLESSSYSLQSCIEKELSWKKELS